MKKYIQASRTRNAASSLNEYDELIRSGNLLQESGAIEESIKIYNKAINCEPVKPFAFFNKANSLRLLKNYPAAFELYVHVLEINPNFTDAHVNIGFIYEEAGDYKNALLAYQNALSIKPDFAEIYNNIGHIYYKLNQHEDALKNYEKCLLLKENYTPARKNLGLLFLKMGLNKKGLEELRQSCGEIHFNIDKGMVIK
jgi:tetratricopeptide (TPR) repeat protein